MLSSITTTVLEGLDFVMEMFSFPRFPRTVSTGATVGRQYNVNSRDEVMMFYGASLYEDCYMNAYPNYDAMTQKDSGTLIVPKPVPSHIFIDLDRAPFQTDAELETALADTLKNIKANVMGNSGERQIVIASGNGYHVHVPLPGLQTPIEEMPGFEPFKDDPDLANKFLRFAERKLSNNKADHCHNPSIKSCLFRVPGTYNTKAKAAGKNPVVRILQGYEYLDGAILDTYSLSQSRPTTKFLNDFHAFLVQQQINDKIAKSERQQRIIGNGTSYKTDNSIWWIEKLLRAGVEDGRKDMLFWVLAPYLITVRKMDYNKAYSTLEQWLDRCNDVRRLEPSRCAFRYRLRYCLDTAQNQERMPIRFETFQEYYPDVYKLLMEDPNEKRRCKS